MAKLRPSSLNVTAKILSPQVTVHCLPVESASALSAGRRHLNSSAARKEPSDSALRAMVGVGTAILVVSSDMKEVMAIADRIMVMSAGRVQGIYDAGRVTEQEIVAYVGGE